jgi:hypothetical protein
MLVLMVLMMVLEFVREWVWGRATFVAEIGRGEPRVGEACVGCSLEPTIISFGALAADETLLNLNVSACSRSLSPRSFHYGSVS